MITYDDMIYFYKDKESVVDYAPQYDDCYKLANTFASGEGEEDDVKYSKKIKDIMEKGELIDELKTFKYFTEKEARELVKSGYAKIECDGNLIINPSQKWHLYVSYIAYQEVAAKNDLKTKVIKVSGKDFETTDFSLGRKIRQKEYVKWIKKEAGFGENSSWKDVENAIKNFCDMRKKENV